MKISANNNINFTAILGKKTTNFFEGSGRCAINLQQDIYTFRGEKLSDERKQQIIRTFTEKFQEELKYRGNVPKDIQINFKKLPFTEKEFRAKRCLFPFWQKKEIENFAKNECGVQITTMTTPLKQLQNGVIRQNKLPEEKTYI